MQTRRPSQPPRLARWLLRWTLRQPGEEAIAGDLEEEYSLSVLPRQGLRRARRWFWKQALGSILCRLRYRLVSRLEVPKSSTSNGGGLMFDWWQDWKLSARSLRRGPLFTTVAALTLALGIGANTALFSIIDAVLLRPLPYANPQELFRSQGQDSYPDIRDWMRLSTTVEAFGAYLSTSFELQANGDPQRVGGAQVMGQLFPLLGVEPLVGRFLVPEDSRQQGEPPALLSHSVWQRLLAADPHIAGRKLTLTDSTYTVVGVMPPGFRLPGSDAEIWVSVSEGDGVTRSRGAHVFRAFGRLRPDVDLMQAQAEMDGIAQRLEQLHPEENTAVRYTLVPLLDSVVGDSRQALLLLWCAVGFLLLIACANVASLLLERNSARRREMALRSALGAGRGRIVRQLMTESLLLSLLAGLLGLLLAVGLSRVIVLLAPGDVPRLDQVSINGTVLLFTLTASLLTATSFGLLPALQASLPDLQAWLRIAARMGGGPERNRSRRLLAVSQLALALLLLTASGLLLKSFYRLVQVEPGFDPQGLLTFNIAAPSSRYGDLQKRARFFDRVIEELKSVPGVAGVAATTELPFEGNYIVPHDFEIQGRPALKPGTEPWAYYRGINPDYFQVMGIPLLSGRAFNAGDDSQAPSVVIINQTMAERFFKDEDPIGQRIRRARGSGPWLTIAGVSADVRPLGFDSQENPAVYAPFRQERMPWRSWMIFALRFRAEQPDLLALVKRAVARVDPRIPLGGVETMQRLIAASYSQRRFSLVLLGGFAWAALALSAMGVYGLISCWVSRRSHEIGARVALGARPADILRLVLGQGLRLTLLGLALGLAGSLAATRWMAGMLFDVSPTDPLTFGAVAALLTLVALLACYLPARRATRVEPLEALRCE